MSNQTGFSLIETIIYCAIMSILTLLVFQFMIRSHESIATLISSGKKIMSIYSIEQRLIADIQSAQADPSKWDTIKNDSFVCQNCKESIGWELIQGNLYRISGIYDFALHYWRSKSRALVGTHIDQFTYMQNRNSSGMIALEYVLKHENKHYAGRAFTMNGMRA